MPIVSRYRQFFVFVLVGGGAALVNVLARALFSLWFPYSVAIVLAFVCGMSVAFTLNRALVFRNAVNPVRSQATWFLIVNLAALALTFSISMLLARVVFPAAHFTWHAELIAHAIGVCAPVISSYLAHKRLSFRER